MWLLLSLLPNLLGIFTLLLTTPTCSAQRKLTYLSTTSDGRKVDIWYRDDGSGRQRWVLTRLPRMKDVFKIRIQKGTRGGFGGEQLLSTPSDGHKIDLYSHDDNSGRQKWYLENIKGTKHFHIRVWNGVRSKYNGLYLTANKSGSNVYLGPKSLNSRSKWEVIPTDNSEKIYHIKVVGGIGNYALRDWGASAHNKRKPLHACEGDCDDDSHCADGLVCFQRNGYTAVPGCTGRGRKNYDYCVEPRLRDWGWEADNKRTLGMCEGDCDRSSECEKGLVCFERSGYTPVPGCSGMGKRSMDYCTNPTLKDYGASAHTKRKPLQHCEGDCDNNTHCAKGLVCFQRNKFTPVPGCTGLGRRDYDYCIEPPLKDWGGSAHNTRKPLRLCEGDCDGDSHCASGLRCFQRSYFTPVPGCSGNGKRHYDYCIPK